MATATAPDSDTEQLIEYAAGGSPKVDREAGVIRGVKILGLESANGRSYSRAAVKEAKSLYEGRQVNFNHRKPGDNRERPIEDRAGWLKDVTEASDGGLVGDLHLLTTDPRSAKVMEAADKNPALFGLSHAAQGRMNRTGKTPVVEAIESVRSVDIVTDPATNKSLFEAFGADAQQQMQPQGGMQKPMPGQGMQPGGMQPQKDSSFDLFVEKARQIWQSAQSTDEREMFLGKLAAALSGVDKAMQGDDESTDPDEGADMADEKGKPTDKEKAQEARIQKLEKDLTDLTEAKLVTDARDASRAALRDAKVEDTDVRVNTLALVEAEEERTALIESWPKATASTPFAKSKPPQSRVDAGAAQITDGKSFARAVTSRAF